MCLIPAWNAFTPGVVAAVIGATVLLAMLLIRRKMSGKPVVVKLSGRTVGTVVLSVVGALVLGVGMCMTMVWEGLMIPGVIVGVVGIVLLMFLIPICKGIKD